MKTEAIYLRVTGAIFLLAFFWGYVCPVLVSSPTDIGLYGGIALFILAPLGAFKLVLPVWKHFNK